MSEPKQLNKAQLDKLQLLGNMLQGRKLEENDKKAIADFIHGCIGNENLNAKVYNTKQDLIAEHKIPREAIFMLIVLTYHTRSLDKQFEAVQGLTAEEQEIHRKVYEYAISYSLKSLHPVFKELRGYGIIELHPGLQVFHERINKSIKLEMDLKTTPAKKEILDMLRNTKQLTLFTAAVDEFTQYWANFKASLSNGKKESPHPEV